MAPGGAGHPGFGTGLLDETFLSSVESRPHLFTMKLLQLILFDLGPTMNSLFTVRSAVGIVAIACLVACMGRSAPEPAPPANDATSYHFCFWNVENLFDDQDDKRKAVDEKFDNAFAEDAKLRQEKLDHLADALLKQNDNKGPDVIALVEVESVRAADLLKATLNKKLDEAKADPKWKYTQVSMKNLDAGRHIAPCIITRLNVSHALTRQPNRSLRILETHLNVNGHDLCIISSHWTSQLRQSDGGNGEEGRAKYASLIYDIYAEKAKAKPTVDFLLCGDFNDAPKSQPLVHDLGATGDRKLVLPAAEKPRILDLMEGKDPAKFGTIFYNGKPLIYDHICLGAGMLDADGWSADIESLGVPTEGLTRAGTIPRQPWRFGDPKNAPVGGRGYSDHFPVTLTIKVAASALPSK